MLAGVNLMTRQTGNRGLANLLWIDEPPRSAGVHGRDEIVDCAVEKQPVAAQTVVVQLLQLVMSAVEKHLRVGDCVAATLPLVVLVVVAVAATLVQQEDIALGKLDLLTHTIVARGKIEIQLPLQILELVNQSLLMAFIAGKLLM